MSLATGKQPLKPQMILVVLTLLVCATGVRADVFAVTIINATFSATCFGGSGICTEVVNGSALYDSIAGTASSVSMSLTGTLNVPLVFGDPPCANVNLCLTGGFFYYLGVPGDNPIEFGPALAMSDPLNQPSPVPLAGGPDGTALFIPGQCGGGVAACISMRHDLDRLVALRPQEIQVGMLKRLRGTPIVRHDAECGALTPPLTLQPTTQTLLFSRDGQACHSERSSESAFWRHASGRPFATLLPRPAHPNFPLPTCQIREILCP